DELQSAKDGDVVVDGIGHLALHLRAQTLGDLPAADGLHDDVVFELQTADFFDGRHLAGERRFRRQQAARQEQKNGQNVKVTKHATYEHFTRPRRSLRMRARFNRWREATASASRSPSAAGSRISSSCR